MVTFNNEEEDRPTTREQIAAFFHELDDFTNASAEGYTVQEICLGAIMLASKALKIQADASPEPTDVDCLFARAVESLAANYRETL